jgi:hypothetical protein
MRPFAPPQLMGENIRKLFLPKSMFVTKNKARHGPLPHSTREKLKNRKKFLVLGNYHIMKHLKDTADVRPDLSLRKPAQF